MAHIIAEARGKIGGTVFSRNTFGAYIRAKVTPVNPATTSQVLIRNQFTSISQSWRGLTQAERDSWNQAAITFNNTDIFGDSVNLSGQVLFMQLNRNLLAIEQPTITSPPIQTSVFAFTTFTVSADTTAGNLSIAFTDPIPAGTSMTVKATTQLSAGVNFVASELRQIRILTSADTTVVDLTAEYVAKFGALPVVGTKVFVEVRPVVDDSGLSGTRLKESDIAF